MHTPHHRPERGRRSATGVWLLRGVVAVFAAWFIASGAVADEPLSSEQASEAIARYDAILEVVGDLRAAIDRTVFDIDDLAFEFAFDDIDDIVAWAVDEIAFEPYAGVLRGPEGTLLARAGNALDQAVFVARLLNDAGFEARVALGELSDADADALLGRALAPRPAPPAIGDRAQLEDAIVRLAGLLGMPVEALMAELDATFDPVPITDAALLAEVSDRAAELEAALNAAGLDLGAGDVDRLRAEARTYAWVEARVSSNQAWTAYHPTGLVPGGYLEASEVLEGTVPEALQHRVRIEAWIESKEDDRLSRTAVMAPWENPSAVFVGQVLDYANAPNGFEVGPIGTFDLEGVLEQTNFFVPYFRGRVAPGALFFDLGGRALPPMIAGDQAAAVIQSVGRAAETGLGALRGIGIGGDQEAEDPDDIFALVGHGFDITLIAPGGDETTHSRWILDRIGAEHRANGVVAVSDGGVDVGRALLQQHRIVLTTGALPQGYLLDLALADLEARRDLLAFTLEQAFDPDPDAVLGPGAVGAEIAADQMLLFDVFDRPLGAAVEAAHGAGYRSAPSLVALTRALQDDDTLAYRIDIVANERRTLVERGGAVALDPRSSLRRGVWETVAEREALRDDDAERVIAAADTVGPFTALRPGDAIDATAFGLDAEALRNLEADLGRGSLVLVPTVPREHLAWWRVDPLTGTTLGVSADGRGQSMTEYTIQLYDMGFTVMFAVKGLMECEQISSGPARACCLLKAHLNNVTGLGLGGMVGGAFGAGAGLAFTLGTGFGGTDFIGGATGLDCSAF